MLITKDGTPGILMDSAIFGVRCRSGTFILTIRMSCTYNVAFHGL